MEWIEISSSCLFLYRICVSTLAVEWIEIIYTVLPQLLDLVSTLAVEWIEISVRWRCSFSY